MLFILKFLAVCTVLGRVTSAARNNVKTEKTRTVQWGKENKDLVYPNTSGCQEMIARASKIRQLFASPNFPNKFADQTQCNWVVQAPSGYRVRLQFKSFYLVGATSIKGCTRQKVKMIDLFTGIIDGPYCGNTPPPVTISSGQAIRVLLESNAVGIRAIYKGFQVSYSMTTKLPSDRFRDSAGKWRLYRVSSQGFTLPPQTTPAPTRHTHIEDDDNNNSAIDAVNSQNNRQNDKKNINRNNKNNKNNDPFQQGVDVPAVADNDNSPIWSPPRVNSRPTRRPASKPKPRRPPPIRIKTNNNPDSDEKSSALSVGGMIGITVAVVVLLAAVFALIYKRWIKPRKTERGNTESRAESPPPSYSDAVNVRENQASSRTHRPTRLPMVVSEPARPKRVSESRDSRGRRDHRHNARRDRSTRHHHHRR